MVKYLARQLTPFLMLAGLAACTDPVEPQAGAATATESMPDIRPSALELELEGQAQRFDALTVEEQQAAEAVALGEKRVEEANRKATSAMATYQSELEHFGTYEIEGPMAGSLKTLMTPVDGQVDCEAAGMTAVANALSDAFAAAVPTPWLVDEARVHELQSTPGFEHYMMRTNLGPRGVLLDCATEINRDNAMARAVAVVKGACAAVASVTPLDKVRVQVGSARNHWAVMDLSGDSMAKAVSDSCKDLRAFEPDHPLVLESEAVTRFHEMTWSSTMAAALQGRREFAENLQGVAASEQQGVADQVSRKEALRGELERLAEPARRHGAEVAARMERERKADEIRREAAWQAELESAKVALEAERAREEAREKAWRRAGNKGMSPQGRAECEGKMMTFVSLRNASTAVAMSRGTSAAADWIMVEMRNRGISDECIQHLNRQASM